MTKLVRTRSPHVPPGHVPVDQLLTWWQDAGTRAFWAEHMGQAVDHEDLYTRLALGRRIADEVMSGRWVTVAALLRMGAVECWADVGIALGITETEAHDGFSAWLTQQADLFKRVGLGLTPAEAAELADLAEGVTL